MKRDHKASHHSRGLHRIARPHRLAAILALLFAMSTAAHSQGVPAVPMNAEAAPMGAPLLRPAPGEPVTYLHVAPIFAARCAKCHTENGLKGPPPEGYRLTSYEAALTGSERARIIPGSPKASELVRRIRGEARPRMPFDGPPYLDSEEIRLIEDWIAQGARNADGKALRPTPGVAVRLHGTMKAGGRLDGLDLLVGPRTRVDKVPASGAYVEVHGILDDKGRVVVEHLRPH